MTRVVLKLSFLIFTAFFVCVPVLKAQESVTLSISPTIFDMAAEPGQVWQSTLRVINVNPFDLTVYVDVVNFAPKGEGGDGRFIPIIDENRTGATLAEWISISREAIVVPREQTKEIPFTVSVPSDASPGGHFAAILVGTKPLENEAGPARLQTAQMVTSLFFARVAGDVIESGSIREFTTERTILDTPEVDFLLRFENKGNVHLQPQGDIRIYNMWNEERGVIPINQYTDFGNVLPNSVRKFTFTWKGEWSVSDVGRYSVVATLGYGSEDRKFVTAKTYFWVIPIKLLLGVLIVLGLFFLLISWLVRLYIRHMLKLAGIRIEDYHAVKAELQAVKPEVSTIKLHAPVQAGILDLKNRFTTATTFSDRAASLWSGILEYRLFILGVVSSVVFVSLCVWYVANANKSHRAYEVVYTDNQSTTSVSSEEILYQQMTSEQSAAQVATSSKIAVSITNRSGIPGIGAQARMRLEDRGYQVTDLAADFTTPQQRTVIVYDQEQYTEALELSRNLNNALISVRGESSGEIIQVFVGSDMID